MKTARQLQKYCYRMAEGRAILMGRVRGGPSGLFVTLQPARWAADRHGAFDLGLS